MKKAVVLTLVSTLLIFLSTTLSPPLKSVFQFHLNHQVLAAPQTQITDTNDPNQDITYPIEEPLLEISTLSPPLEVPLDITPPELTLQLEEVADQLLINLTSNEDISGHWQDSEMVSEKDEKSSWQPTMVMDSQDNIHLFWQDHSDSLFSILYNRYSRNPLSGDMEWGDIIRISNPTKYARAPLVEIDPDDQLHVIYYQNDYASPSEKYYYLHYTRIDALTRSVIFTTRVHPELKLYYTEIPFYRPSSIDSESNVHIIVGYKHLHKKIDSLGNIIGFYSVGGNSIEITTDDTLHATRVNNSKYCTRDNQARLVHSSCREGEYCTYQTVDFPELSTIMSFDSTKDGNDNLYVVTRLFIAEAEGNNRIRILKLEAGSDEWTVLSDFVIPIGGCYGTGDPNFGITKINVAIDSENNLRIAYSNLTNSRYIYYITLNTGTLIKTQQETLSGSDGNYNPKLVIDSNRNSYIFWEGWKSDPPLMMKPEIYFSMYQNSPIVHTTLPDLSSKYIPMSPLGNTSPPLAEGTDWQGDLNLTQPGLYSIHAQGFDQAGNVGYAEVSYTYSPPPSLKQILAHYLTPTLDQNGDGQVNSLDFTSIISQ
jgi:hypothetical protein